MCEAEPATNRSPAAQQELEAWWGGAPASALTFRLVLQKATAWALQQAPAAQPPPSNS